MISLGFKAAFYYGDTLGNKENVCALTESAIYIIT